MTNAIEYDIEHNIVVNSDIDIFQTESIFESVMDIISDIDLSDPNGSFPIAFTNAFNHIKAVNPSAVRSDEAYVRFQLFALLESFIDEITEDNIASRFEFADLSTAEFISFINEPYTALDRLFSLYVETYIPTTTLN